VSGFAQVAAAVRSTITRAKLAGESYFANAQGAPVRTMLTVTALAGETFKNVELILPYGMSARPIGVTADLVLFQIMGYRSHKVALGTDDPALRILDLEEGEFGFRDARAQQVVFRLDHLEVTTPLPATVTATGEITLTSGAKIRLAAPIVEVQTKDWRLDVGGYAFQLQYPGAGNTLNQNTWYVNAVINPGVNNFSPPGVFNGP